MRAAGRVEQALRWVVDTLGRFKGHTQGVAAVEFALLAPLMIGLFVLTLEFSQAIDTSRKLARMTVQIGDLITQQPDVTAATLESVVSIAESTMQPYTRSVPAIRVTGVDISTGTKPEPIVAWSKCYFHCSVLPAGKKGSAAPLTNDLKIPGMYLIRVDASLAYQPIVAWSEAARRLLGVLSLNSITMTESYDQHPRVSTKIPCNGC